jgi:hypothetical protein
MACPGNNVNTALRSSSVATAAAAAAIVLPFMNPTLLWLSQHTLAASLNALAADRIAVGWSVSCTSAPAVADVATVISLLLLLLLLLLLDLCISRCPSDGHDAGHLYQRECRSCTASAATHRQRV